VAKKILVKLADVQKKLSSFPGPLPERTTIERAAKRLGVHHIDADGDAAIEAWAADVMCRNFATLGYFARRGQRSLQPQDAPTN
jgi:hypothetical protein